MRGQGRLLTHLRHSSLVTRLGSPLRRAVNPPLFRPQFSPVHEKRTARSRNSRLCVALSCFILMHALHRESGLQQQQQKRQQQATPNGSY
ncbi:hypothetical protein EJ06DRAFT_526752 [Trichodelitschia bisporula]|uniref:Uncharacterized protein n=1 Tax=Trichodelitschia bisporula TaxID=703511 RepID=A0A6G1I9G1_9PEZI|nr:hypothetical protein EJ06DRAFT_526752 [Trichodelitschia bisporula]